MFILILDKVGFTTRNIIRDKDDILRYEKEVNSLKKDNNLKCVRTQQQASKYMRQKWADFKGEIDKFTILNGDFNASQKSIEVGRKWVERKSAEPGHQQTCPIWHL